VSNGDSDLRPDVDVRQPPPHELDPDLIVNRCSRGQLAAHPPVDARSDQPTVPAVLGLHCAAGVGVEGVSYELTGVHGDGERNGVHGESVRGNGVLAQSQRGTGLWATSDRAEAVHAETRSRMHAAVFGLATATTLGPNGEFSSGVWGSSKVGEGVHGETNSDTFAAVAGIQLNPASAGAGVYGEHRGDGPAGFFKGNVVVTKDIFLNNADCAEEFALSHASSVEPGTVMVIDDEGALLTSAAAYDRRVAGIVSGAGTYKPAIVLDKQGRGEGRAPIALMGKVFCKVDASYGAIGVGDLLTTSATPGHAMRAADPLRAFGAVIGKALRPLADGTGLIPVLVALQ
jgi:hypothetical protein